MYLEVIAVVHYINHDGVIHACVLKACISSKYSKCISTIKHILYTTVMYISSSSFVYLFFSLYCDACLQSSVLCVGVKTLHNTMQLHKIPYDSVFQPRFCRTSGFCKWLPGFHWNRP